MRRGVLPALVVGVALVLGACGDSSTSGASGGTQTTEPVSESETSTTAASTSREAPPVANPKDASGVQDPCQDLLTAEQLAALGFDQPGEPEKVSDADACLWQDRAHTQELIAYVNLEGDIFEGAYRNKETYQVFEPFEVDGLPAVQARDTSSSSGCFVTVGLGDAQALRAIYTVLRSGEGDPCDGGRKAAEAIVGNLPALK